MVHVTIQDPGSPEGVPITLTGLPGFEYWPPVPVQDYWIDKYEVTNRQFKAFLDQGGYRNPAYWTRNFARTDVCFPGRKPWNCSEMPQGGEDPPYGSKANTRVGRMSFPFLE